MQSDAGGGGEGGDHEVGRYEGLPPWAILMVKASFLLAALGTAYFVLDFIRAAYTNWLWFDNLGLRSVFSTRLFTEVVLYLMGLAGSSAALFYAYRGAWRASWGPTALPFSPVAVAWIRRSIVSGAIIMGAIVAFSFASALASRWPSFLRFWNAIDFGIADPQFGNDVGFYVFTLPMLHTIQGWLLGLAIVVLVTTVGLYLLIYSARGINPIFTERSRTHLAVVGAALMVTIAAGHFLDTYETLFSSAGAVTGATYADVNARIPALYLLTAIAVLAAIIIAASIRVPNLQQSVRMIAAAFGLWLVASILAGVVWPLAVQRFAVEPSQFQRERPYIERNIEWTRRGFDLERLNEVSYEVKDDTLARDIAANPETINNIRLWDPRPLESVYNQIQHLRLYYNFLDVDVDRYTVDGELRQVLVSTRELFQHGLDETAQNWINRKLVYTHGFGVVMAAASEFTPSGQPELLVKDVPSVGVFDIAEPRVFYGESFGLLPAEDRVLSAIVGLPATEITDDEVIVNTLEPQFDRPSNAPDGLPLSLDLYTGEGGVPLSNFFRRLMYAWEFEDLNFIFSNALTDESKVLYRRSVRERVSTVAPWLELDDDPYIVVADGKLMWIQDAFVTTDMFPYSRRVQVVRSSGLDRSTQTIFDRPLNYIRNNVKVVVDAFDGSMDFYTLERDEPDPVLSVWRNTFPDLFKPIDQMPAELRQHIRYPEELLEAQADAFLQYHMTDPREFFLKEDQWALGEEVVGTVSIEPGIARQRSRIVDPYYVIMNMPDEDREEFVLILPFTPQDKPNLVAWMAARSDGDHYGDVKVFEFPKDRTFNGPSQIEARIDNDPEISEQFTLWGQSGSHVIRGNLLVIPIGETLLYAEPIYLQADSLAFPELKRVILATGDNVVMEPTLDEAIRAILGGERVDRPSDGPVIGGISPEALLGIVDNLRAAIESLRGGTDALGDSLQALEDLAQEALQ
ncbi:MAG: UPF0182 family protein [Chloroflexi bacterium]|nr:UPF0182 family protein [Chloroflexota bacterium]